MTTNRFNNFGNDHPTDTPIGVGSFLVASPGLQHTQFQKTVIFVLQHNEQGSFGVVLNRPAEPKAKLAWQQLTGASCHDRCFMQGGPIGGPVFAIHRCEFLSEMEIPGGVFVSSDNDSFQELVKQDESDFRIVFGVAGWQTGQLAAEIQQGKWFQLELHPQHVFDDSESMWEEFLLKYGRNSLCDVVGLNSLPDDPLLN